MHEEQVKRPLGDDELEAAVGGAAGTTPFDIFKSASETTYLPYLPGVEFSRQEATDPCHSGLVHAGTVENLQHIEPAKSSGSSYSFVSLGILKSVQSGLI